MSGCGGNCVNSSIGGTETYRDSQFIKMDEFVEGDIVSVTVKCPKSKGPYCEAGEKKQVCMSNSQYITDITSELKKFDIDCPEEPLIMKCEVRGDQFKIGRDNKGPYIMYFPKKECRCKNN